MTVTSSVVCVHPFTVIWKWCAYMLKIGLTLVNIWTGMRDIKRNRLYFYAGVLETCVKCSHFETKPTKPKRVKFSKFQIFRN